MTKHGTAPTKMSTGQFREFAGAVLRSLPDDLDNSIAQGWVENQESLRRVLRETLAPRKNKPAVPRPNFYTLNLDYEMSIEELLRLGKYVWGESNITSVNFPTKRVGKMKKLFRLFDFDREISTHDVLKEMRKMGYRPAEACELLTFGARFPDVQLKFPVVALGSVWQGWGGRYGVVYLHFKRNAERSVDIDWYRHGLYCWNKGRRFAAVPL